MTTSELSLTVILLGSNGSNVELEFRPPMPPHLTVDERPRWATRFIFHEGGGILKDVKYTHDWRCEFCRAPSRETIMQIGCWTHANPPIVKCFIHTVCSTQSAPCLDALRSAASELSAAAHHPQTEIRSRPDTGVLPMLSACAGCERTLAEGAGNGGGGTMTRCEKCRLTRYCSEACQQSDRQRHQIACESLRTISWAL